MRVIALIVVFSVQLSFSQNISTFHKEVPRYNTGKPSSYYTSIRQYEKKLNLDTIENGFDSLQIRIWYHYPKFRTPKNIFIMKRENNKWTTLLYSYDNDTLKALSSKTDMNSVVKQILENDILTLPNMADIKGLHDNWVDGESYTVEVSDKKHYRLYNYHMPEEFKKSYKEAKTMVIILELIQKEFNIPLAHWK